MKTREIELQVLSIMLDLVVLNITILLFATLELGFFFIRPLNLYIDLLIVNLSWVLAYTFVPKKVLYSVKRFRYRLLRISLRFLVFAILQFAIYIPIRSVVPNSWILLIEVISAFFLFKITFNVLLFKLIHRRRNEGLTTKRTLLVGTRPVIHTIRRIIEANPILQFKFVGYIAEDANVSHVLGRFDQFEEIVKEHGVEAVFAELEDKSMESLNSYDNNVLLDKCNKLGIRLYFIPKDESIIKFDKLTNTLENIEIVNPQIIPLDAVENQIKKRIFDMAFSALIIVGVLSWLYPLIALLIKLESRGPVLFKQKRTGYNQRDFVCLKFRSMSVNEKADEIQASVGDARITKVGAFLRKTNLDEFPQFFNVFKGEMSIVGPRPHMLKHTEEYTKLVDNYLVRHYVKPGITGWAQVNGYRGETDQLWKMKRRVEYDMEYIEEWSFDWDLEIVWKTVFSRLAFFNAG